MQIKLNLILSVILEAVKAETYIKGVIDRSTIENANALSYHETAGDEQVHERKLLRGIYTSLDKLKGIVIDYLENEGVTSADNVIKTTIDEATDSITVLLNVNSRFNTAITDSLARLFSKYIEDNTLVYWWGAVGNQQQVQFYTSLLAEDTTSIHRLFIKKPSSGVTIPYTSKIVLTSGSSITMEVGEEGTITYTIDDGVFDDVEFIRDNGNISIIRERDGLHVTAKYPGFSRIKLYSVHDESVCTYLDITITGDSGTIIPNQKIRFM